MAPQEAMSIGNPAAVAAASRHYWAGLQEFASFKAHVAARLDLMLLVVHVHDQGAS